MKKVFFVSFLVFLLSSSAFSETFLEEALKNSPGVRPLGMGGAFVAISDDVNSITYNPAGLAEAEWFNLSYGQLDIDRTSLLSSSFYLLELGQFGYGSWQNEDKNSSHTAISVYSYGQRGSRGINWGISYKAVNGTVGGQNFSGWSSTLGLLFKITPQLNLGLAAQDLAKSEQIEADASIRAGLALKPAKWLTLAVDSEWRSPAKDSPSNYMHYGLEASLLDNLKTRLGRDKDRLTLGLGFDLFAFNINYAFSSDMKTLSSQRHQLSAALSFSPPTLKQAPLIRPKQFALFDIGGSLSGGRDKFSLFGGNLSGVDNLLSKIRAATKSESVDGIILRVHPIKDSLASQALIQEIREELENFKSSGKKVVAYLDGSAVGEEYYLASVADKIALPEASAAGGLGQAISVTKLEGLFKMIGIEWQIISSGKSKNALNPLSGKLTKEQKNEIQSLVQNLYRRMISDISKSRNIPLSELNKFADGGIFTAQKAKELKLVDELGYFDTAKEIAGSFYGEKEPEIISSSLLNENPDEGFIEPFTPLIAVIEIDGDITSGRSSFDFIFGGKTVGADTICEQIKKASEDWRVKGIIVRINTPGGDAAASDQIFRAVEKVEKPAVASMGDIAASGGYYIAAACDRILANPSTITGSIGVFGGSFPALEGLYKKFGISVETFKEGKHADMFSGRKLTKEEIASLKALSDASYQLFLNAVARGRGISRSAVEKFANGRIYTGDQAKEIGMIDEIGGFLRAVEVTKDLAKIKKDANLVFFQEEEQLRLFQKQIPDIFGLTHP